MRIKRNERIGIITRILSANPNKSFTLSYFSKMLNASKSTICEDIVIIRDILNHFHLGDMETATGAAGGVKFIPKPHKDDVQKFINGLCETLSEPDRLLPGGFLFMTDLIYDPQTICRIGEILASQFMDEKPDIVLTIETKGVPVAMMTAFYLGCPVITARRDSQVTEGSLISINYVSASSKRIQTMSLPKRAVKEGQRALIIDDFMKGGGTAKGLAELLKEFRVEHVGTGVIVSTKHPESKLISDYKSLIILDEVDELNRKIKLEPAPWV